MKHKGDKLLMLFSYGKEYFMIFHELNWLWTLLGIALLCAFIAFLITFLICKFVHKQISMKVLIIAAVIGFLLGVIGVFIYASQAMPL